MTPKPQIIRGRQAIAERLFGDRKKVSTVRLLEEKGALPVQKIGGSVFILAADLNYWIENRRVLAG